MELTTRFPRITSKNHTLKNFYEKRAESNSFKLSFSNKIFDNQFVFNNQRVQGDKKSFMSEYKESNV